MTAEKFRSTDQFVLINLQIKTHRLLYESKYAALTASSELEKREFNTNRLSSSSKLQIFGLLNCL
jgi:hypothetical protein